MVSVPGFLLRRLYVNHSLRKIANGFEFELKNDLGSGYAYKLWPITVDGIEVAIESTSFILEGSETPFDRVSKDDTFVLAMNRAITVHVNDFRIEPGPRKIEMAFDVPGLGTLRFNFTDILKDE